MRLFVLLILLLPGGTCWALFHPEGICSIILAPTTDTLPPSPQLHAALDTLHHRQLLAALAEFDDAGPKQWMNYVPSVGIGYNLQGQPRPTMSFSLAQIFSAQRQRSDRQAKRRSIQASAALDLERLHHQLDALLQRHALLSLELATMRKVFEIEVSMYELALLDYEAAKLAPVAFLPKQKAFLESGLAVMRKEMEVAEVEGEIANLVNFTGEF